MAESAETGVPYVTRLCLSVRSVLDNYIPHFACLESRMCPSVSRSVKRLTEINQCAKDPYLHKLSEA